MKVLIIGAGAVGLNITQSLVEEGHQVTVIENDATNQRELQGRLNALFVHGNGASWEVLESADVMGQDIFIAVTNSDEVNLISCLLASKYKVATVVARLKSAEYNTRQAKIKKDEFGIDLVINPGEVVARDIRNMVTRMPGAFDALEFAEGKILFLGFRATEETPICGLTLKEIGKKRGAENFRITAITRGQQTLIPRGEDRILADDAIYFMVTARALPDVQGHFIERSRKERNLFIYGCNALGHAIASRLETHYRVKIFDGDKEACDAMEDRLAKSLVFNADGTDIDVLSEEGLENCDVFIAVSENEELNILSSLLAKHHGARRAFTLVNRQSYIPMVRSLGVDRVFSARVAAANHILRFVRRGDVLSMAKVEGNDSEVLEFNVSAKSSIAGKPLRKVSFPRGSIVGGVIRAGEALVPTGMTSIEEGDRVVVFTLPDAAAAVGKLFS